MKIESSNTLKNELIDRLYNKKAIISIIGLGYVGLPLSLSFIKKGYKVFGIDIDINKIECLQRGESYINHIDNNLIKQSIKNNLLNVTNKFEVTSKVDAIIICVPTPLNQYREPDLRFIKATMKSISPHIKSGQIISLESTTYPGTTEEELSPIIENKGLEIGKDFFLVYSPEREDPGNPDFNTSIIPKVLGGVTPACNEVGKALYSHAIDEIVSVSSPKVAEMTKLLENIHRAVNIGLMNELKPLAEAMGIDLYEVIRAASTKPFGFVPYYPGPGLGGHCIPIDPFYLTWKAREYGMHTRFIELAGEINTSMPRYVVQKTVDSLNLFGKALKNSKVLVLGIAYKKNVDDMRESPSVEIMKLLSDKGAEVYYSDPFFETFPKMRSYQFNLSNTKLTNKSIEIFDAVILSTDHDSFDYDLIRKNSKLLIDTRGRFEATNNIFRA